MESDGLYMRTLHFYATGYQRCENGSLFLV